MTLQNESPEGGGVACWNGNIKTLQRTASGNTVDNLVYSYTGNQLTGLTGCIILKKVYSKVTLDINLKCKNHRGGKNEEPPRCYFVMGLLSKDEEVKAIPFTLAPDYPRGSAELEEVMHSILVGECVMWDSTSFLGFITPVPPIEGQVVIGCGLNCSDTTRQVFLVVNLVDRILIQASQVPRVMSLYLLFNRRLVTLPVTTIW